jgi:hypothetical protein
MLLRTQLCTAAALAFCAHAAADTLVVDDDGGPGVDFTDIPPAVAAANAGDLVLVLPGSYSGFTVGVGLTILGTAGVSVGEIVIDGASAPGPIVLASLAGGPVTVRDCADVVVLQDLTLDGSWHISVASILIEDCDDVRLRGVTVQAPGDAFSGGGTAIHAERSRIEIVESRLDAPGGEPECLNSGPGRCLFAEDCDVRFARSTAIGGWGVIDYFCGTAGGDGADGLRLTGASDLILSGGPSDEIAGGFGGGGPVWFGAPGTPVVLESGSAVRYSGVNLIPGWSPSWSSPEIAVCPSCTTDEAIPADPTLEVLGDIVAGSTLPFRLHATPGATAQLILGR